MSKYTLEIQDTFNEYWVTEAIKWLKSKNYDRDYLIECYNHSNYTEILDALYMDRNEVGCFIFTTEDLINACKAAVEQGNYNGAMYRAYALWDCESSYYKPKYWCYNGNPVPIGSFEFGKVVRKAYESM